MRALSRGTVQITCLILSCMTLPLPPPTHAQVAPAQARETPTKAQESLPRAQVAPAQASPATAEGVVRELYDILTFPAGTTPDWDRARALILPEAVVVLRTSRTTTAVFSVEGWIQDFVYFIEQRDVKATGFVERIVRTHATEFGDVAHVWVLYEAEIPGSGRPPQDGVDGFHLVRRDERWFIASIVNEIPTPERPVPELLRGG